MACPWRRVESPARHRDAPHAQVLMVPFTYHFPPVSLLLLGLANAFSLGQTVLLNKVPGVRQALGVPIVQTQSKVRKPTAPPVETVFGRLEKAIDTAKNRRRRTTLPWWPPTSSRKAPRTTPFLKSRPAQQVVTHAQPPKQKRHATSSGGRRKEERETVVYRGPRRFIRWRWHGAVSILVRRRRWLMCTWTGRSQTPGPRAGHARPRILLELEEAVQAQCSWMASMSERSCRAVLDYAA